MHHSVRLNNGLTLYHIPDELPFLLHLFQKSAFLPAEITLPSPNAIFLFLPLASIFGIWYNVRRF